MVPHARRHHVAADDRDLARQRRKFERHHVARCVLEMHHGRVDVTLGIEVGGDSAAIYGADSFDGDVANPNRRGHHHRVSRHGGVGREHRLDRIRIELRHGVAVVVDIENKPQHEFVTSGLVVHVSCASRQPPRLAFQCGLTKSAEIRQRQRQHQAHDKNHDREFEQREARRCGRHGPGRAIALARRGAGPCRNFIASSL